MFLDPLMHSAGLSYMEMHHRDLEIWWLKLEEKVGSK